MFERGEYMKSIPWFKSALALNSIDPVAKEYLYHALVYSGYDADALLFYKNNESALKDRVKERIRPLRSVSVEASGHFNTEKDPFARFDDNLLSGLQGYQVITHSFFAADFLLNHDLGKRLSLTHGGTFLDKRNDYYVRDALTVTEAQGYDTRQYQYYAGLAIHPGLGFTLIPSAHVIRYLSPALTSRMGRFMSTTILPDYSGWYYLARLSAFKHFWLIDNGAGFSVSTLNDHKQIEGDYNAVYYPLGNLNLYITGTLYALWEDPGEPGHAARQAWEGSLGIKLAKILWLETDILSGEIKNMSTNEGFIIYNGQETITARYGLSLLFPTPRLTISIRGALVSYDTHFMDLQNRDTGINIQNFNGLTLTGGLKWNIW